MVARWRIRSSLGCTAVLVGLPIFLIFLLNPLPILCDLKGPDTHTYTSFVSIENDLDSIGDDKKETKNPSSSFSSFSEQSMNNPSWESATCRSYKSLVLNYPNLHATATYNLKEIVQDAPPMGWTCKAAEPLFELDEYPPFFRSILSIMFGPSIDKNKEMNKKKNILHKHKNKHVFFSFNPCKLLPLSCHGSRGRLFKFAAKLKKPHDPQEEIERLLIKLLKAATPSSSSSSYIEGKKEEEEEGGRGGEEEEADTTECLQNVLSTENKLFFSNKEEEEIKQQKEQENNNNNINNNNNNNNLLINKDITDDTTPWIPINPYNPYEGIQTNIHHIHIFCPNSSLHTHVMLKCPYSTAAEAAAAATSSSSSSSSTSSSSSKQSTTKFELCEHPDPCRFNMILTTAAACPTNIKYSSAAAAAAAAAAGVPSLLSGKTEKKEEEKKEKEKKMLSSFMEEEEETKDNDFTKQQASPAAAAGAATAATANNNPFIPNERTIFRSYNREEDQQQQEQEEEEKEEGKGEDIGIIRNISYYLVLLLRIFLCCIIFAWLIYNIKDWAEINIHYEGIKGEGEDIAAAAAAADYNYMNNINSYDSCVEVLKDTSLSPTAATAANAAATAAAAAADNGGFELAIKYKDIKGEENSSFSSSPPCYILNNNNINNINNNNNNINNNIKKKINKKKEYRGIFSSPSRRFIKKFLPNFLHFTSQQFLSFSNFVMHTCYNINNNLFNY